MTQPFQLDRPLRLVSSTTPPSGWADARLTALFALEGCRDSGEDPEVRTSAFLTLVEGLWEHETLELVLRLDRTARQPVVVHIGLRQNLASAASQTCELLPGALVGALPRWQLTPVPVEQWPELPEVRAVLRPASLLAGAPGEAATTWLPLPVKLPCWGLTTPFDEPLSEAPLVLRFRFRSSRLNQDMRQTLHRSLLELRRGGLRLHASGEREETYLHDLRLEASALEVWPAMLRAGTGWTFDVEVRCGGNSELNPYALKRLQRDIFSEHPSNVLPGSDELARAPRGWPLLPAQGLPGAFPSLRVLLEAGVRSVPRVGAQPPHGPGLRLGETASGQPVVWPSRLLTQHSLVLGGSGTGKSNLLRQAAIQQMCSGGGLFYLDPHGPDFDTLMTAVPQARAKDVVVLDLDAGDFSGALNPMQGTRTDPRLRRLVATRLGDLIDKQLEVAASRGPRVAQLTRDVLEMAMLHPDGGTLADAERLLLDADFADWLLGKETSGDRLTRSWTKLKVTSGESGFDGWMSYLQARFSVFTRSLPMLATLSRPSTLDLAECLRRNAIVLVRMPQAVMSEGDTRLLGSMLLAQLQWAAMSETTPRQGPPFLVIVDEYGLYASASAPSQWAQLRKFGVALCAASQSLASLRSAGDGVCTAVVSNAATKVLFRLAPREAIELDEYTAPEYPAREVSRLPNHQAVLAVPASGSPPVRFHAALALPDGPCADPAHLRQLSGASHATALNEAMAFLQKRHPHLGTP